MLKPHFRFLQIPSRLFIIATILALSWAASAQNNSVAIGSTDVKDNAVLWLNGDGGQGLLLPAVAAVGDIASPDAGMIVYQTSDNKIYYRNASAWVEIGGGSGGGSDSFELQINTNNIQLFKNGNPEGSAISLNAVALGAGGGDIDGTIDQPQIKAGAVGLTALADMGATNGDILQYNGSAWTVVANSGGGGTDDQTIDQLSLNGTNLELSLEDDGQPVQTVDLSSLAGTDSQNLSATDGGTTASVDISGD